MEAPAKPVGAIDYPTTFQEFDKWFADEDACLEYIGKLRWPNGFTCPNCGLHPENPSRIGGGLYLCVQCKKQTSITAGTLFHQTHKSLRTWFLAMWFITSQKYGTSALGLQRVLGIGSYNTAWNWLHKLRRAMVCPERNRLTGTVEVDETYIGGVATGARGRGAGRKSIVVIAVEVLGRGMGRIRMSVIPDVSANSLHGFISNSVEKGSEVRSDGWSGYKGLEKKGYSHDAVNISESGDPAHVVMSRVHRVASQLNRWWLGIHQGAIRPEQLAYYLDEFTFRFNRRTSKARGLLFYRLAQLAADCKPIARQAIIGGQKQHVVGG